MEHAAGITPEQLQDLDETLSLAVAKAASVMATFLEQFATQLEEKVGKR